MTPEDIGHRCQIRIHAIVLTQDRPETLRRCINAALSSLGPEDMLSIVDDSRCMIFQTNAAVLASMPSATMRAHLLTSRVWDVLGRLEPASSRIWSTRTASRDIAPLRNLSLLISVVVSAETTVLIDDDIHGFDLVATHSRINALAKPGKAVIAGAEIAGISELDVITRLADAIDVIARQPARANALSVRDLFQVNSSSAAIENSSKYVSAGYLAFRIPAERLFAFPPGYNEDWLWCLLYSGDAQVQILRTRETVLHDPPSVKRPNREDLIFELFGDFVFECLEENCDHHFTDPEATLSALSTRLPRSAALPSARIRELLDKARLSNQKGSPVHRLDEYGLSLLAEVLQERELDMHCRQLMTDWCGDAIAKHRSVGVSLSDKSAISALEMLLQEGRL